MTDWQIIYAALLAASLGIGRPVPVIWAVMIGNLAWSAAFGPRVLFVALGDLLAAVILMAEGRRAMLVAGLFVVMIFVEVLTWCLAWPNAATYAIVDVLAYIQCGVIAHADTGIRIGYRAVGRWINRWVSGVAQIGRLGGAGGMVQKKGWMK